MPVSQKRNSFYKILKAPAKGLFCCSYGRSRTLVKGHADLRLAVRPRNSCDNGKIAHFYLSTKLVDYIFFRGQGAEYVEAGDLLRGLAVGVKGEWGGSCPHFLGNCYEIKEAWLRFRLTLPDLSRQG